MAVNDVFWTLGDYKLVKSSGTTVTPHWSIGLFNIRHEYIATTTTTTTTTTTPAPVYRIRFSTISFVLPSLEKPYLKEDL